MAKKVVKKKKPNERAQGASKSGARDNLREAYKNNTKKAQKNKNKKVKSSWGEVSGKAQDTQQNRNAALSSSKNSAQAAAKKNDGKPKGAVRSSWGEVVHRTQTVGQQGKKNLNAKGGTADFINKNKKGGVNFNVGGKTIAQTSKKTDHSNEVEQKKSTGTHKNDKVGKAYSEGSNRTKTGTVAEKKKINLGNAVPNAIIKAATTNMSYAEGEAGLTSDLAKQAKKDYKKYVKDNNLEYNKETAKKWIRAYNAKDVEFEDGKTRADIDKDILKSSKKYGKAVADSSAPKALEYQDLTASQHDAMTTAAGMTGYIPKRDKDGNVVKDENGNTVMVSRVNQYLESQEKGLSEKVGSVTAAGAYKGKAATGFMQGSGMVNVLQSGVGEYNDAAKNALTQTQNSTAFNVGYGAGIMGQFIVGGVGSMGESLGEGAAKLAMNGSKGLLGKAANLSQRNMATKFLTNRAGELLVESPLNFGDAVKMATDANGNVDKDALATYMKFNTAMTAGMGGAIEGIGLGVMKSQVKQFERLYAKKALGGALSPEEEIKLAELGEKINEASNRIGLAKSRIADKTRYHVKVGQLIENVSGEKLTLREVQEYLAKDTIHSERMATAEGLRDASLKELDDLRTERLKLIEDPVKNADKIKNIEARMKEAQSNADLATRQLDIEIRRNKHTLKDLNKSLSKMEKATGLKYDVMDNSGMIDLAKKYSKEKIDDNDFIKGFIYKDENGNTRIAINSESPQAHQTVIGHETGHFLKDVDPDEFNAIGDMVADYARKLGEYDQLEKDMRKWYPDATPEELTEELRCELIGRYVYGGDDAFIKRLAGEKPSILKKIVDYFKELLGKSADTDLSKELKAITDRLSEATKNLADKSKVTDEAYMKAAENGDLETAQKMVDEVAKNNGYTIKAYRGGVQNTYSKENGYYTGTFFSSSEEIASAFASGNKENVGNYYIKMERPLVLDAEGHSYVDIPVRDTHADKDLVEYAKDDYEYISGDRDFGSVSADDIGKWADEHGYDGVVINNVKEGIGGGAETDYIVINPEHIKSSDAITRDDNNNIIPLSKRFNEATPDSRFSIVRSVKDKDGKEYKNVVKLDNDIFDGLSKKERANALKDRIINDFMGHEITAFDENGKPLTLHFAEWGEWHKKNGGSRIRTITELSDKPSYRNKPKIHQDIAAQIDEVVEVAKGWNIDPENSHGWLDKNGWVERSFVVEDRNGKLWECKLSIANADDGRKLVYDVGIQKEVGERDTAVAADSSPTTSKNKIAQQKPKVNTEKTNMAEAFEKATQKKNSRFSREARPKRRTTLNGEIKTLLKDSHLKDGAGEAFEKDAREVAALLKEEKIDDAVAKTQELVRKHMTVDEFEAVDNAIDENVKSIIKSSPINIGGLGNGTIAHKLENIGLSKADVPSAVQLRSAKGGRPLDNVYTELSDERPDIFPPDASSEDKLKHIIDALTKEPDRVRKPQEWIDGEYNDLTTTVLEKIADGAYADMRAAEEAAKPKPLKPANRYAEKATDEAHQKAGVSQEPVADISDKNINAEIAYLNARLRNGKTPESQALREERLGELYAEAEKRGIEIRNTPRRRETEADLLIKNKGIGYEEAESLKKEIEALKKKRDKVKYFIDEAGGSDVTTEDVVKYVDDFKKLTKELSDKRQRLDKVIRNSKSTIKDGEDAYEVMKQRGLGNKTSRVDKTKWSEYKETLPENESVAHDMWTTVRRLFENSHVAFENQAKAVMRTNRKLGQDMLAQINNVIVSRNIAAAWVETARTNAKGIPSGKSLNDVFTVEYKGKKVDLRKNDEMRGDLSNYLYLKHSIAREKVDKEVFGKDFTMADVNAAMESLKKKYGEKLLEDFSDEVQGYIKSLNEFRLDTGLINAKQLAEWNKLYPNYVPTYRAGKNTINTYDLPSNKATIDNGIKTAKGSDEEIEDLYLQLAKMTDKTIKSGHQNKMVEMYAESMGLKPIDIPKDASLEDIAKSQIVAGRDKDGSWTVSFYKDGEHITVPVDKQIAKGLREWNVQDKRAFIQVMSYGAKITTPYKALITDLNLIFGVRNGMRDAQQALVNSKDSVWYMKSVPSAGAAVKDKTNAFRLLYDANGGKWSSIAQLNKLDDIAKINKGLVRGTIDKGIDFIESVNGAIEMMPRMSEFIGTIQKEADKILKGKGSSIKKFKQGIEEELRKAHPNMEAGKFSDLVEKEYAERVVKLINDAGGTDNIIALAMRNASDITVNFSRSGIITKGLNVGLVPYLNPSVQGLSKTMRMFSEGKANEALLNFMFKMTLLTTAPAVANEILCANNEAYQSLNTRDKDANFFIPLSLFGGESNEFIKFPKPRENSVLAEPAEYFARFLMDRVEYGKVRKGEYANLDEFKQMFVSAQENVGIINIWEDNLISPIWKTANNETWYGGEIESHSDMYDANNNLKKPSERYDESTSPVAIWLGRQIGKLSDKTPEALKDAKVVKGVSSLSPKKIDNIMDSYLGMIYDLGISQTSQKQRTDLKGDPLKRNPVFAQFLKDAVFSNKTSTQFWQKIRKTSNEYGEQSQEYREYMSKYGYDSFTYDDAIAHVDTMKKLSDKEKVAMKRELRTMKNQLMQRALDGKPVKYDPMQRIINLYDRYGVENATDKALSTFAYGDHLDAYNHLKTSKEYRDASPAEKKKWQQRFLNTYKDIKRIQRKTGGSDSFVDYSTAVFACVKNGYDKGVIANNYCWKQKDYSVKDAIERTQNYLDKGYTEKNFVATQRAINAGAAKLGKYPSDLNDYDKSMILAEKGYKDGAFYITSKYLDKRMNASRCLVDGHPDGKWTDKKIDKFCNKYGITHDKNYQWDLEQVADAIKKEYKNKTPEEQAAIFTVITGNTSENPFGEIGNYAHENDSGLFGDEDKDKKGGRRRGGRRGRRGGGGGGSGGGAEWYSWLKSQGITQASKSRGGTRSGGKVKDNTSDSLLNEAYRKKLQKNIKATRKK